MRSKVRVVVAIAIAMPLLFWIAVAIVFPLRTAYSIRVSDVWFTKDAVHVLIKELAFRSRGLGHGAGSCVHRRYSVSTTKIGHGDKEAKVAIVGEWRDCAVVEEARFAPGGHPELLRVLADSVEISRRDNNGAWQPIGNRPLAAAYGPRVATLDRELEVLWTTEGAQVFQGTSGPERETPWLVEAANEAWAGVSRFDIENRPALWLAGGPGGALIRWPLHSDVDAGARTCTDGLAVRTETRPYTCLPISAREDGRSPPLLGAWYDSGDLRLLIARHDRLIVMSEQAQVVAQIQAGKTQDANVSRLISNLSYRDASSVRVQIIDDKVFLGIPRDRVEDGVILDVLRWNVATGHVSSVAVSSLKLADPDAEVVGVGTYRAFPG